jgi:hypothetical protein
MAWPEILYCDESLADATQCSVCDADKFYPEADLQRSIWCVHCLALLARSLLSIVDRTIKGYLCLDAH